MWRNDNLSALRTRGLKKKICSKASASEMGYPRMPASDEQSNRELDVDVRPLPTEQLLKLLSHLRGSEDMEAATLTNYGMKVPVVESLRFM